MIGDESRGWAWTRALQGVPANEVHLCGDGSALPLVSHGESPSFQWVDIAWNKVCDTNLCLVPDDMVGVI